jgi:hypothetical protein
MFRLLSLAIFREYQYIKSYALLLYSVVTYKQRFDYAVVALCERVMIRDFNNWNVKSPEAKENYVTVFPFT